MFSFYLDKVGECVDLQYVKYDDDTLLLQRKRSFFHLILIIALLFLESFFVLFHARITLEASFGYFCNVTRSVVRIKRRFLTLQAMAIRVWISEAPSSCFSFYMASPWQNAIVPWSLWTNFQRYATERSMFWCFYQVLYSTLCCCPTQHDMSFVDRDAIAGPGRRAWWHVHRSHALVLAIGFPSQTKLFWCGVSSYCCAFA